MEPIADILARVQERIEAACQRAGRQKEAVEVLAVTKTHGPEVVREAFEAGLTIAAENKVQEAAWKIPESPSGVTWHLIGHLQRNKVRAALEYFSCIHSVDSIDLIRRIDLVASECGKRPDILLEVNVSGEASKFGLSPEQLPDAIEAALGTSNVTLLGLMTMAPFTTDPETARPVFRALRELRDQMEQRFAIALPQLSMGMSGDYEVAVEEGATWLRLGTVLFGERPKYKPATVTENFEP